MKTYSLSEALASGKDFKRPDSNMWCDSATSRKDCSWSSEDVLYARFVLKEEPREFSLWVSENQVVCAVPGRVAPPNYVPMRVREVLDGEEK